MATGPLRDTTTHVLTSKCIPPAIYRGSQCDHHSTQFLSSESFPARYFFFPTFVAVRPARKASETLKKNKKKRRVGG